MKVECVRDERFVQARRVKAKNFFAELKRRTVYKVAIAYRVIAWLLKQIAQIAFENYCAGLSRLFNVESDDLYRAE
ncbi:MAG TPA: hypothetical protein VFU09_06605 [Candidatus Udaeobacter sp.]|nr:hypothetical protein [Candidatus Udaeobacter sp.]